MWWVVWLSRRLMFLYYSTSWRVCCTHVNQRKFEQQSVEKLLTSSVGYRHGSPCQRVALDWKWFRQCWLTHDVLSHAEGVVGYGTVTRQLGGFTTPACCVGYWKWFRQCWLTHDVLSIASPRQRVGYWKWVGWPRLSYIKRFCVEGLERRKG